MGKRSATDHHAIIPTRTLESADLITLPSGELAVLDLIALPLVCTMDDPCHYSETTVTPECVGYQFEPGARRSWTRLAGVCHRCRWGERRGRCAAIIEKLVQKGFVECKGNKKVKVLIPTDKGRVLIAVVPEQIRPQP